MTARPWGLGASVLCATLVHAAVLAALGQAGPRAVDAAQAERPRMALRVIAAAVTQRSVPGPADDAATAPAATPPTAPPTARSATPAAEPPEQAAQPGRPEQPPDPWPDFIAAGQLTQATQAAEPVQIPFPDVDTSFGVCQAVLLLLVDASGGLFEIQPEDPALAAGFLNAIRKGLASTRFVPGRIGDMPVKTRLRVLVTFDGGLQTALLHSAD